MDKRYLLGAGAIILVIGMIIALYAAYPQVSTIRCTKNSDCYDSDDSNGQTCQNGICGYTN